MKEIEKKLLQSVISYLIEKGISYSYMMSKIENIENKYTFIFSYCRLNKNNKHEKIQYEIIITYAYYFDIYIQYHDSYIDNIENLNIYLKSVEESTIIFKDISKILEDIEKEDKEEKNE